MKKILNILFIALILFGAYMQLTEWISKDGDETTKKTESRVQEVKESNENCAKLNGATDIFLDEVSRDLNLPKAILQVRGAVYGVSKIGTSHCLVFIQTPNQNYLCGSHKLLSDDGGETTYAQGFTLIKDAKNGMCESK